MHARRASPLHAARASVATAYWASLAAVALLPLLAGAPPNPILLAVLLLAIALAGAAAGSWRTVVRSLRIALPMALFVAVVNGLVARDGLTVLARLGNVPVLGEVDVTLEALVYGAAFGLALAVCICAFGLAGATVDPDEQLRSMRRISFRSALTATIATRMVPVLRADATRMRDAQRCRPGGPPARLAVVRAVAANALDRAVNVAATLEVRGFGSARRPPRLRRPASRHDIAFGAAALAIAALAIGAQIAGLAGFVTYPRIRFASGAVPLAIAMLAIALAPFAQRRGIEQ